MMGKVAIHGFGRIGRSLLKVALKNNLFVPVLISDIKDIPTLAALAWDLGARCVLQPPQPIELLPEVVMRFLPTEAR